MKLKTSEILDALIRNDESPPFDDYNHRSFGQQSSENRTDEEIRELALTVLEQMPACTSSDFVGGLLDLREIPNLKLEFLQQIKKCRYVDSAGTIVHLLSDRLGVLPDDLVEGLASEFERSTCNAERDRLAYALWCICCGSAIVFPENRKVSFLVTSGGERIRKLLRTTPFSEYTGKALTQCLEAIARVNAPRASERNL